MKPESVEVSAKTVEEAVALALEQLEASQSEVEIEVLDKGKSGILGIGAEEARVIVRLVGAPSGGQDLASLATEILEKLLSLMGVDATVHLRTPEPGVELEGGPTIALDITGEDLGILIGRRGETLQALQYTVNLIVGRRLKARASVAIDVEGYRQRREQSLKNLAARMAERANATGQIMVMEPMPAKERRIVHLALADDPNVSTESVGLGESRKVTISPKRQ
ncbi:MAG: RNA-binding cell elongation regulator Jag/EloR [Chloroflexota bacterium]